MLDIRHVYIFQIKGTGKYKIGISKRVDYRRMRVDAHTKKKVIFIFSLPVLFAELVEYRLHQIFGEQRFYLHDAGPDAGRTEWFRLRWHHRLWARLVILFYHGLLLIFRLAVIVVILDVIIIYAEWKGILP